MMNDDRSSSSSTVSSYNDINDGQQRSESVYNKDIVSINYTKEEPLSWNEALAQFCFSCGLSQEVDVEQEEEAQLLLSCGPCQEKDGTTMIMMEEMTTEMDVADSWTALLWHLSGMEFIRIASVCGMPSTADVLESMEDNNDLRLG
mmetsp:Transcript_9661/g.20907  ORF Transcript_9661/g.20907 Transcript_9661/m.20907 type:complete len:146 (+) Transcript_9661:3-440(+)